MNRKVPQSPPPDKLKYVPSVQEKEKYSRNGPPANQAKPAPPPPPPPKKR